MLNRKALVDRWNRRRGGLAETGKISILQPPGRGGERQGEGNAATAGKEGGGQATQFQTPPRRKTARVKNRSTHGGEGARPRQDGNRFAALGGDEDGGAEEARDVAQEAGNRAAAVGEGESRARGTGAQTPAERRKKAREARRRAKERGEADKRAGGRNKEGAGEEGEADWGWAEQQEAADPPQDVERTVEERKGTNEAVGTTAEEEGEVELAGEDRGRPEEEGEDAEEGGGEEAGEGGEDRGESGEGEEEEEEEDEEDEEEEDEEGDNNDDDDVEDDEDADGVDDEKKEEDDAVEVDTDETEEEEDDAEEAKKAAVTRWSGAAPFSPSALLVGEGDGYSDTEGVVSDGCGTEAKAVTEGGRASPPTPSRGWSGGQRKKKKNKQGARGEALGKGPYLRLRPEHKGSAAGQARPGVRRKQSRPLLGGGGLKSNPRAKKKKKNQN